MKVEIELPEIIGFEYTGEFGHAEYDDYYLDTDMTATWWGAKNPTSWKYPILRKMQAPIVDGYTWDGRPKRHAEMGDWLIGGTGDNIWQWAMPFETDRPHYIYTKDSPPKPTPSELAALRSAAMLGSDRYVGWY